MSIQGVRHTDNFVTDARPKNWREGILLSDPNGKMPLTGLTSGLGTRSVDDPEFNWWTKVLQKQRFTLDSNETNSATTLSVTSGARKVVENHLLKVEDTGEIVRVTSDPSTDTAIDVERGFAGTSAAAVDAGTGTGVNPNLLVIGSAFPEGSTSPTGLNYDPAKVYNYTQIFRNSLEATRTAMKTRLRTGDQVKEAKREALQYHGIEIERALWFGSRNETTLNGKPQRTTGGIDYFLENFSTTETGYDVIRRPNGSNVDMETLEDYLNLMFRFGSTEKMGICGNRALLTIQRIVRKNADLELISGQKEMGMNVSRLISPFGTLVLKTHPLFNYAPGGTNNAGDYFGLDSRMYVLDMENIRYVHLTDSDTQFKSNIEENDLDGRKSEYLTECGLEFHHPETHFKIEGLTSAAADS